MALNINCRVWNGEYMIYPQDNTKSEIARLFVSYDNAMFSLGNTDGEGNVLFEGDIVKTPYGNLIIKFDGFFHVVKGKAIDGCGYGLIAADVNEQNVIPLSPFGVDMDWLKIGNIHEHPHLLTT